MKMRTKEETLKVFGDSLKYSPDIIDIAFKRLMLELLIDMRDAVVRERKK